MGKLILGFGFLICLTFSVLPAVAGAQTPVTPSMRMALARQCFAFNRNCERLKSVLSADLPGITGQDALIEMRHLYDNCPVAHEAPPSSSEEANLIVHDYDLLGCFLKTMARIADKGAAEPANLAAEEDIGNLIMMMQLYVATEYDLRHISAAQYQAVTSYWTQTQTALFNVVQTASKQADEIAALRAQLSALESQDHKQCRAIQAMAAINGGVPPNCN